MPTPTSADRAAEMNRLLIEEAHLTRSVDYGYQPTEDEKAASRERSSRLIELIELLGSHINAPGLGTVTPEAYVHARISSWLAANPMALTNHRLIERVQETTKTLNPNTSNTCGVTVQIGEGERAYHYSVTANDLVALRGGGRVIFRVPESVAEHFRQQARRELQSELRLLLNAARA